MLQRSKYDGLPKRPFLDSEALPSGAFAGVDNSQAETHEVEGIQDQVNFLASAIIAGILYPKYTSALRQVAGVDLEQLIRGRKSGWTKDQPIADFQAGAEQVQIYLDGLA